MRKCPMCPSFAARSPLRPHDAATRHRRPAATATVSATVAAAALLLAMIAGAGSAAPADDAPDDAAATVSLDGTWRFRLDPEAVGLDEGWHGAAAAAADADADADAWDAIDVPGFWEEHVGHDYDGVAWYARDVTVPAAWADRRWALVFDGVDDEALVFVDGTLVKANTIWNRRFWVLAEEMPGVAAGDTFRLAVRVLDKGVGGGIWRPVALRAFDDPAELRITAEFEREVPHNTAAHGDHVVYCIFVRNFTPEGTLAAAAERMAHVRNLGATMVWVMPIQPIGADRRKGTLGSPYSIVDYKAVDPLQGTLDDARRLVEAAHEHGMTIILDLVANHTAWDAVWMESHPEWYTRGADGEVVPPVAGWWDVADLDFDADGLRDAMEDVMRFWVEDVGFDGFRCDVAGMVPGDFWRGAIERLHTDHPRLYMLAEWDGEPTIFFDGFNAMYDNGLHSTMYDVMWRGEPAARLLDHVEDRRMANPRNAQFLRFTENHDQRRAAEAFGPAAARALEALVLTIPGTPLIYNGREIAAFRRVELFDREPIDWEAGDVDHAAWVARLVELRHRHPALRHGEVVPLRHDGGDRVLVYGRTGSGDRRSGSVSRYAVALNLSSEARDGVHVAAWPRAEGDAAAGAASPRATRDTVEWRDLLTGRTVYRGRADGVRLDLGPHEVLVMRLVE